MNRNSKIASLAKIREDYSKQIETLVALLRSFLLKPGDNAIDGGASGGGHSRGMSTSVGPKGIVYSFEAAPGVSDWLRQKFQEREINNVVVSSIALGNGSGSVEFVVNEINSGLNHVRSSNEELRDGMRLVSVRMSTLDLMIPIETPISFIKLDVEGMELEVMKGGYELIKRDRPIIVFENARADNIDEYFKFFEAIEYDVFDFFSSKITRSNYNSQDLSVEAVCGPRDSIMLYQSRWLIESFWQSIQHLPPLTSWSSKHWEDPISYLLDTQ